MCNDVGRIVLEGLGNMDCMPHPRGRMLVAVPCLDFIWRQISSPPRWNTFFPCPPTYASRLQMAMLDPHGTSRLDGKHLAETCHLVGGTTIG
jgi:hypothetical protein